jgi:hypothetical protein
MTSQSRSDSSSSPANLSGLFLQPSTPPPSSTPPQLSSMSPDESSSPTSSPATELPTDDLSGGWQPGDPHYGSDHGDSSSPRSTGELPKGSLAGRGELASTVRAGVTAATSAAHELLADDDAKSLGAFLAEDDEVDGIADAAAGLLSRRVPAGVGNPDVTDLVKLGLILAGYIGRQFRIRRQIKAMRAGAVATVQPEQEREDMNAWADPYANG